VHVFVLHNLQVLPVIKSPGPLILLIYAGCKSPRRWWPTLAVFSTSKIPCFNMKVHVFKLKIGQVLRARCYPLRQYVSACELSKIEIFVLIDFGSFTHSREIPLLKCSNVLVYVFISKNSWVIRELIILSSSVSNLQNVRLRTWWWSILAGKVTVILLMIYKLLRSKFKFSLLTSYHHHPSFYPNTVK